jgi:hypothetical protein
MSYEVNFERLNRTAARIVKGLYMHVTGQPLPANYVACALFSESLIAENQNTYVRMLEQLNAAEPHSVGSVFEYRYIAVSDICLWLIGIYQINWFVGQTAPATIARWPHCI